MGRYFFLAVLALVCWGCAKPAQQDKPVIAKINDYEITRDEFEQEFKDSYFGQKDTLASRKEFLDNLVNRKLILQDAQAKGLDHDPAFLKLIEKFWEQSLLRVGLERKARENSSKIFVSDKSVEDVYQKMLKEKKTNKPYSEMYNQIKWEITKLMEAQAMAKWVDELRRNAEVKIKYNMLEPAEAVRAQEQGQASKDTR